MAEYTIYGFTWQGVWSSATAYNLYDVVQQDGSMYNCVTASTNNDPSTDGGVHWQLAASIGATGPAGPSPAAVTAPFTDYRFWSNTERLFSVNQIIISRFTLPYAQAFNDLTFYIGQADTGGSLYDFGIYDASGSLVANVGAQTFTSTGLNTKAVVQAPVTIPAGLYFFAFTGQNATGSTCVFYGSNSASIAVPSATMTFQFSTSTTSSGGGLPSTISITNSLTTTDPGQGKDALPFFLLS